MTVPEERRPGQDDRLLQEVRQLLSRNRLVEELVHRQDMPRHDLVEGLVHKQHLATLQSRLDRLPPADVAALLERLEGEERSQVWDLVKAARGSEIFAPMSEAVW